ncbi:MAG: 1-acyl-sn-glycerol-3-phosphate acyltransferase [candidate division WOR-3 bacterium]|nr:MAG: 1-acyl-sn-glycerol-3-phosphate acyltransferase [candidate division WOR-3 bacterium]
MWSNIINYGSRLRSIIVSTIAMYAATHLMVFALMPVAFMVFIFGAENTINKFKRFFAGVVFDVIGKKIRVIGIEKIRNDKKYLVICNYPSGYATFALMKCFPSITFVADDYLTNLPFIAFFLKHIHAIFVDQKNAWKSKAAIDERLKNQSREVQYLLIYPEGRRTVNGHIGRFKCGFGYILRHSEFDLLPVTANGFYQLKPVKRVHLDPNADLEIIIHEPIANSEFRRMSKEEATAKSEEIIKAAYRP